MTSDVNESASNEISHAEKSVKKYLDSFLGRPTSDDNDEIGNSLPSCDAGNLDRDMVHDGGMVASFDRVVCCNSSRSLYCKECCNLLVPDHLLPKPISTRKKINSGQVRLVDDQDSVDRPLRLPFNLHIVLDDRRGSATGLHSVVLLNGRVGDDCKTYPNADNPISNPSADLGSVKLIDLANDDEMPRYGEEQSPDNASTFLLFPSQDSVPLESVASQVKTLVVLDCKWTKSSACRKNEDLAALPKVHLSSPPRETYYWRWHNAGKGMASTMEAIYYAAYEVSQMKYQKLLETNEVSAACESRNFVIDQRNLLHLLWLFGHQRAATFKSAQKDGTPAPCTDKGKELQRALRKQKGTWRQLRHKEDERRLMERNRIKEEKKVSLP